MSCSVCAVKVGSLSLLWISLPFRHWSRPFVNHRDKKNPQTKLHSVLFWHITSFAFMERIVIKKANRGFWRIQLNWCPRLCLWISLKLLCLSVYTCLHLQAFRDKMCIVPARDPPNTSGPESSGLCVPPSLLCLCNVQQTASHRRWVLPHGGRKTRVQGGLWNSQTKWWAIVFSHAFMNH